MTNTSDSKIPSRISSANDRDHVIGFRKSILLMKISSHFHLEKKKPVLYIIANI